MSENKKSKIELSIIIVNYNGKNYLFKCLRSIYQFPPKVSYEIIVVDNNSDDGSQEMVRKNFPEVKLVCNKENLGFTRANNIGIKSSKGEFILFLNNDTRILKESIDLLLNKIKTNPDIGVVAPALLNEDFSYQLSYGAHPNLKNEFFQKYFMKLYFKFTLKRKKDDWEKRVDWVSGACFLTRREILESVNYFDENFFLYFDDSDLCARIRKLGKKIIYYPKSKIVHYLGKSKEIIPLKHLIEYRKSQLYFYRKHNSRFEFYVLKLYLQLKFLFILNLSKILKNRLKYNSEVYLKIFRLIREWGR
ncbi:glycosyltransferase family 2 protein [Candidatus Aminicenantes bacterium AC-335-A11]|jgi:hypothetical protein|nr:glycosyltransferase family 2 protein [SCandidatus Aminicenantes bacterium Aminicenantia_JdfR_composite]MCP2597240.1 glycosyltransferase family 2 protein [Candidatus Aminicenantes bacterium AC-335-G13]MCP2605961.1 glycosyltransferase family 2 protein [Candidatus Aminicenantes bacterium AC-708-I09]MCP2618300.1 glycosyltransferase family 2 protein [Candidatus Aminicenantes bacterium AC-335-A11]MCP2620405.1 glycosyltransferase family 2 protein [Candidatus Aminicenantes bacterium AC-334-E05]